MYDGKSTDESLESTQLQMRSLQRLQVHRHVCIVKQRLRALGIFFLCQEVHEGNVVLKAYCGMY